MTSWDDVWNGPSSPAPAPSSPIPAPPSSAAARVAAPSPPQAVEAAEAAEAAALVAELREELHRQREESRRATIICVIAMCVALGLTYRRLARLQAEIERLPR